MRGRWAPFHSAASQLPWSISTSPIAWTRAGRTINMEIGALRWLLKQAKLWRRLAHDIKLLPQRLRRRSRAQRRGKGQPHRHGQARTAMGERTPGYDGRASHYNARLRDSGAALGRREPDGQGSDGWPKQDRGREAKHSPQRWLPFSNCVSGRRSSLAMPSLRTDTYSHTPRG